MLYDKDNGRMEQPVTGLAECYGGQMLKSAYDSKGG